MRKFNNHLFLSIPLTTKIKENRYYLPIIFKEQKQSLMLSQLRVLESKRLTKRKGKISDSQIRVIKKEIGKIIFGNYPTPHE